MKYILRYWDSILLLVLIWCILNEDFSLPTIFTGVFTGFITILSVRLLFSANADIRTYRIRPYLFVWFIVVLIYQIMRCALQTAMVVFQNSGEPVVVELKTKLKNHWFQCLVANSITLTPGTVTIEKSDQNLKVLWLHPTTDDTLEQQEIIFGPFERLLKRGDYK